MEKMTNENNLLYEINCLEKYLQENQKDDKKIWNFLADIKEMEPELSIASTLNRIIEKYNEGYSVEDIDDYIDKSQRIFLLAKNFVTRLEKDTYILELISNIHKIIINNFNTAKRCFRFEFCITEATN